MFLFFQDDIAGRNGKRKERQAHRTTQRNNSNDDTSLYTPWSEIMYVRREGVGNVDICIALAYKAIQWIISIQTYRFFAAVGVETRNTIWQFWPGGELVLKDDYRPPSCFQVYPSTGFHESFFQSKPYYYWLVGFLFFFFSFWGNPSKKGEGISEMNGIITKDDQDGVIFHEGLSWILFFFARAWSLKV